MATEWKDADGTVANVNAVNSKAGTRYSVVFTYKVDGSWYGGTFTTNTPYSKGDTLAVQYDPSDPERNKYVRDEKRMRLAFAAFAIMVTILAIYFMLHPPAR